ncbi:MAG: TraR/DksA C4-type zinc finger protein [Pseudobdellovibrionaceae bacterium]|nr:TraR/DksA C4-type zinc finger protein [Bdellovibrionales bacterium]USN46876.1 MAG: TraR/DksA C4-type zinc finger protein [Pseudobdellovibrionaceae bacterium]
MTLTSGVIEMCKEKLITEKETLLNQYQADRHNFQGRDVGKDEADLSVQVLEEHQFLAAQRRLRHQLLEIETALARIAAGTYGICEETEEPIEVERLLALPATRLSIEGAEIREQLQKRFASTIG